MKTKLKTPEVAKEKGADMVKKMVKKRLTDAFEEGGAQFLYDAEFDYGSKEAGGTAPMLFVGELSSEWRKYLKENKTKASLAAGRCAPAADNSFYLNLEVKLGKGGKAKFLKLVNKELLKPFAEARFVDSLASGKAMDENADLQDMDSEAAPEAAALVAETDDKELLEDGAGVLDELKQKLSIMQNISSLVKAELLNIKNVIIDNVFMAKCNASLLRIEELDLINLMKSVNNWLANAKKSISNPKIKELYDNIEMLQNSVGKTVPDIQFIEAEIKKVEKVAAPGESGKSSDSAPVSTNPLQNMETAFKRIGSQFAFTEAIGQILKKINQ